MRIASWFGLAVGVLMVLGTGSSVFKYLLVPRSTTSFLSNMVGRMVSGGYRHVTDRIADLALRERTQASGAPAFLAVLLLTWLAGLLFGYALILWPFCGDSFSTALRTSGSSMFTLGFAVPPGGAPDAIIFVAAASGLIIVALLIAYLPVMYAAFNRRETLVRMLEALTGNPAWGPELLARQALIDNVGYLPRLYERWTEWAADISESHTAYRNLIYFRSPDPDTSWLISLIAVLDAAALHLALCPQSAPSEARPLLRVGYTAIRRLAETLRLPVKDDPHPDDPLDLTRADFDEAVDWLRAADWIIERDPDDAWPHFSGWRVNYETPAYAMARYLDLPPALWTGSRRGNRPPPPYPYRPPHREPGTEGDPAADQKPAAARNPGGRKPSADGQAERPGEPGRAGEPAAATE